MYFARDAKYSDSYSDQGNQGKYMFVAKVLTGRKTVGKSDMRRPPPVDPNKPSGELYASCVNDIANPSIFVVFERDQCYPEYLVHYHKIASQGMQDPQPAGQH